jgi:WXG100 family type VII secretion target
MAGGDFTKVLFGGMQTAEADFASVHQALQSTLTTLESQLQGSMAQWTGAARDAYWVEKTKWDAAAADMAAVVAELSKVVGLANENFISTENVNRGMWA